MAAGRASALTVDGDGDGAGRRAVNGTAIGIVTGRDIAAAAEQDLLDRLTIEDVSVAVEPLALDDAVERAVELGARAGGRPVPVVDDAAPVGTVQIPFSPLAQAGPAVVGPDVPVLPPAPAVVSRPQGRSRFYLRRSVRQA
jgi:CBS domain-containing protein